MSTSSLLSKHSSPIRSKYRKITLDSILAATSLTRSSKETHEAYLQRVTHLHLQGKRIKINDGLELCTNLKVLFLYDNQIELIQNLDFATLLQYLYLQNNFIKQIPNLSMKNLRKLFLDDNEIAVVTGLTECTQLEELTIARQRLPSFSALQFDAQSLHAISRSLESLDISGNGIVNLQLFTVLFSLKKFICQENTIIESQEIENIVALPNLEEANFLGNPACKLFKYRDVVIGASSECFCMLDEVAIPRHQQVAIKGLMDHRKKIGTLQRFQPPSNNNKSGGGGASNLNQSLSTYNPQDLGSEESFVMPNDRGY